MRSFLDLYRRLDPDPRIRGRQFEHVCKWFLANDPTYKRTLRRVWLWDDWSGRWGGDAGIDLVAEDFDGRLWAIQAKAYAAENTVTKKDVDKFLAESSRAVFSYRLLIATTDKLHHIARRTINDQEKKVFFVGLSDLITCEVDWPADPFDPRPSPTPKSAEPRDYQLDAIRGVVNGFRASDRGQLIMACGTGKTLTSLFINEELGAKRTLVLAPSLSLLKQTMQVWRVNAKVGFDALPVCSDGTVGRGEDEAVAHTSELGIPAKTDPGEIAEFLRRRPGPRVVFSTYQSCPQVAAAFTLGRVPAFDLVVADEAHRVAGPVSSQFATVLDATAIKAKRRLFMTATPRYFTGRVLKAAQDCDFEVASMDDKARFGPVFHRLTFGEAINLDLLTDYQVVVVGVTDDTYRQWTTNGVLVTRDGEKITDARTLAGQIGLAKAMRKYDLRRIISFHSRVARAQEFVSEMREVIDWIPARQRPKGTLWADFASGEMTAGERHVRLQHLSRIDDEERGLLANARCLAEGVDVPTLDGVAFIDPRRSEVDIVQAVGRAIRKAEDKTIGTIVIPVFIDTAADPETALDDSAFKPVWDVVKALRAHDDELAEQIDALRRGIGRNGRTPKLPCKLRLDLPVRVGAGFAAAFKTRLVEQTSTSWGFWFGLLERYVEQYGDALVPQGLVFGGCNLGTWVSMERSYFNQGKLSLERQYLLESLPGWAWDRRSDQWEAGFTRLQTHVAEYGSAGVRDDYVCPDGYRLGKWVGKQRAKWAALPDSRRQRLQELPGWTLDARSALWEASCMALTYYAQENGHANPPRGLLIEGIDLESWVRRQRRTWDELDPDRRRRLQVLPGWTLDARDGKWDTAYRHLRKYVAANGTAQVKQSYVTDDGYRLGKWVSVQRRIFDTLSDDRRRRLEELPGWSLNARSDRWEGWFQLLQEYVVEHGDSRVPGKYVYKGRKLGAWVANQKSTHKKLTHSRRQRLEKLPGWTLDYRTAFWEDGYHHLRRYAEEHGAARPPSRCIRDGFKLGIWVNTQRQAWDTLDDDRKRRLQELPGWTLNTKVSQWDQGYEYLCKYVEQHGDARVPEGFILDGFKLGQWVRVQRSTWQKLREDRRRRLQELSGWLVSVRDSWWEDGFEQLRRYAQQNGHACTPQSYVTDGRFALGAWVATQRQTYLNDQLSADRRKRLESLPGWSWRPRRR